MAIDLRIRCELLRALHRPGAPLLLPNVWDAATAKSVVAAGFPVVATTSWGVAAAIGYQDHQAAPAAEMFAAAARIARCVDVPVTVDAEGGYGMEPELLVATLQDLGAAGCNLEDTDYSPGVEHDHAAAVLRDPARHAAWLREVRRASEALGYPLVINARVDTFLGPYVAGAELGTQRTLVPAALERATAFLEAGADCVYPIALCEPSAIEMFMSNISAPVNLTRMPGGPTLADLRGFGVARVSWAIFLYQASIAHFEEQLRSGDLMLK